MVEIEVKQKDPLISTSRINFFFWRSYGGGEIISLSDWLLHIASLVFRWIALPPLLHRGILDYYGGPYFRSLCHTCNLNTFTMVLQDLGRRINSAVNDLTRSNNLDEKVCYLLCVHSA